MNILLTSIGRRGYLASWFKAAVGNSGRTHAASSDGMAPGLQDADFSEVFPPVAHPEYARVLVDYCSRHSIDCVVPLIDVDVVAVAEIYSALREVGAVPVVPTMSIARTVTDKWAVNDLIASADILPPRTFLGFDAAIDAVRTGQLSGPLVVKPRFGMGSIGVIQVDDASNLRHFQYVAEAASGRIHSGTRAPTDVNEAIVVQPYFSGQVFNIDIVNDIDGNFETVLSRRRLSLVAGESFSAETVNCPMLEALGAKLAKVTRHAGSIDVDVIRTADGKLIPIDINPRFGGGYPFSHQAGADIPRAIVAWLRGDKIEPTWLRQEPGIVIDKVYVMQRHRSP